MKQFIKKAFRVLSENFRQFKESGSARANIEGGLHAAFRWKHRIAKPCNHHEFESDGGHVNGHTVVEAVSKSNPKWTGVRRERLKPSSVARKAERRIRRQMADGAMTSGEKRKEKAKRSVNVGAGTKRVSHRERRKSEFLEKFNKKFGMKPRLPFWELVLLTKGGPGLLYSHRSTHNIGRTWEFHGFCRYCGLMTAMVVTGELCGCDARSLPEAPLIYLQEEDSLPYLRRWHMKGAGGGMAGIAVAREEAQRDEWARAMSDGDSGDDEYQESTDDDFFVGYQRQERFFESMGYDPYDSD